ncbi:hypothetical protein D934_13565 [Xylella fastidiosa subsp. sandyi Ann-1]|uniref:Uncharacterized protein n=1 Tax=Xylella fastidiosa subsp. sandyi Ann-1 TaxID=155920 RepID=A0A060H4I7_XYLFS|nr:hypothetical protein D934_13565 [Xylella fastidiosa subsp. sandyi Ann-1]KAF0571632.1 hypothetical protein P305_03775 [Xylella fastidiosa subsp. fastidiosa Mus-1]
MPKMLEKCWIAPIPLLADHITMSNRSASVTLPGRGSPA